MKRKRGSFFTFLFSLIPGAGEMYLGFFKHGTCLMSLFFGSIICSIMLFSPLMLFSCVIWFYSFFHTNNINYLPDEEFAQLEDNYLFPMLDDNNVSDFVHNNKKLCSFLCILIGIVFLYYTFTDILIVLMPDNFYSELHCRLLQQFLPRILLGSGCIVVGYHLICGKKIELYEEDKKEENNYKETKIFSEDFKDSKEILEEEEIEHYE